MDPKRTDLIELLALACLEDGPLHGYGVYKQLALCFGEALSSGKVYSVLGRLEEDGLTTVRETEGRRKDHELTPEGRALLTRIREAPEPLRAALVELFDLEPEADLPSTGPWQDVTVHRDMVRDQVTITLEMGDGEPAPELDRLLRSLMRSLLG